MQIPGSSLIRFQLIAHPHAAYKSIIGWKWSWASKRSTANSPCTHTAAPPPRLVSLPPPDYHACCQTNHFCGVGCEMGLCVFYLFIVGVFVRAAYLQLSILRKHDCSFNFMGCWICDIPKLSHNAVLIYISRTRRWNVGTHGGLQSNATCKILHIVKPRPTVWLRCAQQSFWAFYYFYHLLWLRASSLFSLKQHLLPLFWLEVKHWLQTWSGGGLNLHPACFHLQEDATKQGRESI